MSCVITGQRNTGINWCLAQQNHLHTHTRSRREIQQAGRKHSTRSRSHGCHLVLLPLLAAWLISFQPPSVRGEEPLVELMTQNKAASTEDLGSTGLRSHFPLHFLFGVDAGYDDNGDTTGGGQGSSFTSGNVALFYNLGNQRTRLTVHSGAGVTYFPDLTNRTYDVNTYLDLSLSHNVSRRLVLNASISTAYKTEPDFRSDIGVNSRNGNYFVTTDSFSTTYQWSRRFSTVTSSTFRLVKYDDLAIGIFEDRSEETFGEQFRFSLSQRTTLVTEHRFEIINYDRFPRDSTSHFCLAGVDYSLSRRLNVTVRGGATFRSYKDDGSPVDPHFEGSMNYVLTRRSSLNWTTSYGTEEPNSADALSRTTFRTGLQANYRLSSHVSSAVAAYYHHDENRALNLPGSIGMDFSEDSFDLSLSIQYAISNRLAFHLALNHSQVDSGEFARGYSRNHYSAGLSLAY